MARHWENQDEMNEKLLAYINGVLLKDSHRSAGADTLLFADGWIDSLKILQLIAYLEILCGHGIPDEEIVMKNFATVRTIVEHFGPRGA